MTTCGFPKRYRLHGPGDDLKYWKRAITMGNIGSTAMCVGIMKSVYEIIKKWTTERVIAGKPLKEHTIVADMLSEVAILIESASAWMWCYTRQLDHPDIYGWAPWDERFLLKTRGPRPLRQQCRGTGMQPGHGLHGFLRVFKGVRHREALA